MGIILSSRKQWELSHKERPTEMKIDVDCEKLQWQNVNDNVIEY